MDDKALAEAFFATWAEADTAARAAALSKVATDNVAYADPNSAQTLSSRDQLNEMLGHFSANMAGGSAWVVGTPDGHNGWIRATVAFGMNGSEMMRGQYIMRRDGDLLTQIVGFMGMGE